MALLPLALVAALALAVAFGLALAYRRRIGSRRQGGRGYRSLDSLRRCAVGDVPRRRGSLPMLGKEEEEGPRPLQHGLRVMPTATYSSGHSFTAVMIRDSVIDWQELSALYEQAEGLDESGRDAFLAPLRSQKRERRLPTDDLAALLSGRPSMAGIVESLRRPATIS
jgi:hypothetical protein